MGKRVWIAITVVVVLLVAIGAWAAWTLNEAREHMVQAENDLREAQASLQTYDAAAAQESVEAAKVQTADAAQLTNRWVWRGLAAVPKLGDSLAATRSVILAADAAVNGLAGITDSIAGLDLQGIMSDQTVDLTTLASAGQAVVNSSDSLSQARAYLADSPRAVKGDWVLPIVERTHKTLSSELATLESTAAVMEKLGTYGPRMLGADKPKTYFVAVQAPNETRGTGGLLGSWAVVRVDNGTFSVVDSGANEDLPDLKRMPGGFGPGYAYRYGDDPTLVPNMNMSPDYPVAAQLWLDAYKQKTGKELDGALSLDVNAISALVGGDKIVLPDGQSVSNVGEYLLTGIYQQYPSLSQNRERRQVQAAIAGQVIEALFTVDNAQGLLDAMGTQVGERRVMLWVKDPEVQAVIADTDLGHSLQPAKPHSVEPVLINIGWSKLDGQIVRGFDYQVGRCPALDGTVRSELTMQFKSDIRLGERFPEYMVGTVPVGPTGPINQLYLQAHLPPDSEVIDVFVDGKGSQWQPFEEAGRPIMGLSLALPPREVKTVKVVFDEPGSGAPGEIQVQPMQQAAGVNIGDRPC